MTKVVYLDVVLAGNFVMNYVILWSTAKFARFAPSRWRLVLGSAVGSIYALTVFIPWESLLIVPCKLVLAALMVWLTFKPLNWRHFFTGMAYFYINSFAIGGLVLGTMYFMQSKGIDDLNLLTLVDNYFWLSIISALMFIFLIVHWGSRLFHKQAVQYNYKRTVVIKLAGAQVELQGLIDTGNFLNDPLTGMPVIIAEYDALKCILPVELNSFYDGNQNIDYQEVQKVVTACPQFPAISIIPYQSIGKKNGMMLGLKPEAVVIQAGQQILCTDRVIVGIHKGILSPDRQYQALLSPVFTSQGQNFKQPGKYISK